MLELLSDPNAWAALLSLTALEIVLGIDNVIFLSIVSARLPLEQQKPARRIGLALAPLRLSRRPRAGNGRATDSPGPPFSAVA